MKIIKPKKREITYHKFSDLNSGDVFAIEKFDGEIQEVFMKVKKGSIESFFAVHLQTGKVAGSIVGNSKVIKLEAELKVYGERE